MQKIGMPPNQQVNKKSILVADDEETICDLLSKTLNKEGYQVVTSFNGRDVIDTLQRQQDISLVIMDVNMPEITGLEALSIMRDEGINLPVIMVTGECCQQSFAEARRLEVFAYLTKPFELREIKRLAKEALDG